MLYRLFKYDDRRQKLYARSIYSGDLLCLESSNGALFFYDDAIAWIKQFGKSDRWEMESVSLPQKELAIATIDQPAPIPNENPPAHDLVIEDIQRRKALGIQRYGTTLQANNGRNQLIDAYQEALDLVCYLRAHLQGESW